LCFMVQAQTETSFLGIPVITKSPAVSLSSDIKYVSSSAFAFSPDGSKYITLSSAYQSDYYLRVWDTNSGILLKTVFAGSKSTGSQLAYSGDGSAVFTVLDGQPILIWDAQSWTIIGRISAPHNGYVSALAVNPKRLELIISLDNTYILNAVSGKVLHTIPEAHSSLAYSPDGTMIALGSDNYGRGNPIRVLKSDTFTEVVSIPQYHKTGGIEVVSWSPLGNQIAVVTYGPPPDVLRIYNLNAKLVFQFQSTRLNNVANWSPDGAVIAVAADGEGLNSNDQVLFFDAFGKGKVIAKAIVAGDTAAGIQFSNDGKLVGTGAFIIRVPDGVTATIKQIIEKQANTMQIKASQLAIIEPLCDSGKLNFATCTRVRNAIEAQDFRDIPDALRFLNGEIDLDEFLRLFNR
jgi:WD40 repeat protein